MGLENETAELYLKAIEMIEAQNMLLQMNIADYPHMKAADRKKYFKTLHKKAYPPLEDQPVEVVKVEDFAKAITRGKDG